MNGLGCLFQIVEAIVLIFITVLLWKAGPEPSTGEKIFNGILFTIMVAFGGYLLYKEIKKINKEFADEDTDNQKESEGNSYYVSLVHNEAIDTYKVDIYSESEYVLFMQQVDNDVLTIVADHLYPSKNVATSIQTALYNSFASNKTVGEWFNIDQQEVQQIIDTLK